ncbi:MAG: bifunctional [glutamine synthetase] adenylyltransferase/[glutamine synthetase]-adenylyl-L-tyrosine phosphorylase, partial [Actinomycetota bacterium]
MPSSLTEVVERSAAPAAVEIALDRLAERHPDLPPRLEADEALARAVVSVISASRSLTRVLMVDPDAIEVLADLDRRSPVRAESPEGLARWKRIELLRIAARDLLGRDGLELVGAALAQMADDVLGGACALTGGSGGAVAGDLAVIGMGKLGGRELNYASDIDLIFAGEGDPRPVMDLARRCFRVDANLRPEGRSGPLIRSLASYRAYWDRWAQPWELQALLKARPVAGDPELGAAFIAAAASRLWGRPFGADELRAVRAMKARAESAMVRRGLAEREVKRGRGGIRDVEFAVQLLQLVHGRQDPALRSPNTLAALAELGAAGYVHPADAVSLKAAYDYLRTVEHRLQLAEGRQVHAVPADPEARGDLARVMGYRDDARTTALARFDADLRRHRASARSIHERLYFRPLLEAFAAHDGVMTAEATEARLSAFGFADVERTRQALGELTRGLTRSSRLMQQMLPLILGWLSESPDPDLGLLGLRALTTGSPAALRLVATFRESPETARRLCVLHGTSRLLRHSLEHHPEMAGVLSDDDALRPRSRETLAASAAAALQWRADPDDRREALTRLKR